mmetsp:Transcript_60967/g.71321  ORF Transcript_60967/g.71321 Transcript_60967/m.71321 type:complete len:93 (+) Transcript_60967:39-317(+)
MSPPAPVPTPTTSKASVDYIPTNVSGQSLYLGGEISSGTDGSTSVKQLQSGLENTYTASALNGKGDKNTTSLNGVEKVEEHLYNSGIGESES